MGGAWGRGYNPRFRLNKAPFRLNKVPFRQKRHRHGFITAGLLWRPVAPVYGGRFPPGLLLLGAWMKMYGWGMGVGGLTPGFG
jgi:hypothetical protein